MWLRSVGVEQQGVLVHRRFNRCMGHHNTSRLQQRCSVAHKGEGGAPVGGWGTCLGCCRWLQCLAHHSCSTPSQA